MKLTHEPHASPKPYEGGEFMRGLEMGNFLLELYQLHGISQRGSHTQVGYRFFDFGWRENPADDVPVFEGHEEAYGIPIGYCIDSPYAFKELLGFLCLKQGDTDDEHFADYTTTQIEWRDSQAEELSFYQMTLEEQHNSLGRDGEVPSWGCDKYSEDEHEWIECQECAENWDRQAEWQEHVGSEVYLADEESLVEITVPVFVKLTVVGGRDMKDFPTATRAAEEGFLAWIKQAAESDSILNADLRLNDLVGVVAKAEPTGEPADESRP